ncbi:MAG: hypothetical protein PHO80_04855, partial [Candidatus Gracilibacteria bacterium]|nr:hypothetical protein [Candidatus Gracilibacteria bacterium]
TLSGINNGGFYYRDNVVGTGTLTLASAGYSTGSQSVVVSPLTILADINLSIAETDVGVGQSSDAIYVTFSTGGIPYTLTEDTKFTFTTDNSYGTFSRNDAIWQSITETVIPAGTNEFIFYYSARNTANNNIKITSNKLNSNNLTLASKNKLNFISGNGSTISIGQRTSRIQAGIIDPRYSISKRAKGILYYSGNTQPIDGDIVQVDNFKFEFDNNGAVTTGNIYIGIADSVDNTWKKFADKVNEKLNTANAIADIYTDRVYIEARKAGILGNEIKFSKLIGSSFNLNGSGKLGGTIPGYGKPVFLKKDTEILLSSTSPTGKFFTNPDGGFSVDKIIGSLGSNSVGFYYTDITKGTYTITVSYTENGIDWLADTYTIEVKNPTVSIENGNQILTTTMTGGRMAVKLLTSNYNDFKVPNGKQFNIKLTTNSLLGNFGDSLTGSFSNELTLNLQPGEYSKYFYYKDGKASIYSSGGISQTTIKAELVEEPSLFSETRATIIDYSNWSFIKNMGHISSYAKKQFNIDEGKKYVGDWISSNDTKAQDISVIFDYSKLLVLLPGESLNSASPTGKSGTGIIQKAGNSFMVTVLGVSDKNTKVTSINTQIELISNHPGFIPIKTNIINGEAQIPVTLTKADPLGWTFTARDLNKRNFDYKLVFTTPAQTIKSGGNSDLITVQLRNNTTGLPINVTKNDLYILLDTSTVTGLFSRNLNLWTNTILLKIPVGSNSANVYYKDATIGTSILRASSSSIKTGEQIIKIIDPRESLSFITPPKYASIDSCVGPIVFGLKENEIGNYVSFSGANTIDIGKSSITGQFYSDDSCDTPINSLNVTSGSTQEQFYYKDPVVGSYTIDISNPNYVTGSQNIYVNNTNDKIAFISSGQILPLNEVSDPITIQLQNGSGGIKNNTLGYTLNLTDSLGQGEFSLSNTSWSPINQVTFNIGENTKTIYFRGKQAGTHQIIASNLSFGDGSQNIAVKNGIKLIYTNSNNLFGVNRFEKISYNITDSADNPITFTKDVYINVKNDSSYGRFAEEENSITNTTRVKLNKNTNSGYFYYRNSVTGAYKITTYREGFIDSDYSVIVKNRLALANTNKTISYGEITSLYKLQFLTPYSSSGTKAKGSIHYSENQPNDGDIITIDQTTFEFDNNGIIGSGRIFIGIGNNSNNTWKAFSSIANSEIQNILSVIDMNNKTVFVEARTPGIKGNSIVFTTNSSKFSIDGAGYLGGTTLGTGDINFANKNYTINLTTNSSEGTFSLTSNPWIPVNSITFSPGDGEKYFYYRDAKIGNSTISVDYAENSIDWMSDSQVITIKHPYLEITSKPLIIKKGVVSPILNIQLENEKRTTFTVPTGKSTPVSLTTTSTGGLFSIDGISDWTGSLNLVYGSGESFKNFYYK